jgi:hypothetical protein
MDSFEHEAANESTDEPRVVLVVDMWHPDLTDEEVKFFSFINKAQMNAAKRLSSVGGGGGGGVAEGGVRDSGYEGQGEDFMSVIKRARRQGVVPLGQVWPACVIDD